MKKIFSVAGLNADPSKADNIRKLMHEVYHNPETYLNVKLQAEPDNTYDKNAIRIEINEKPVGYIARADQPYLNRPPTECEVSLFSWGVGNQESLFCNIEID